MWFKISIIRSIIKMLSFMFISWWQYMLGGFIGGMLMLVYICYRGYQKVAATPLDGIPCPPLSHPMLGHPECMIHPMKHEMRSSIHNATRVPLHQLVLMKQVSLFVNDPIEALRVLLQFPSKPEKSYESFRYDVSIPDIFTSDSKNWEKRHEQLGKAFSHLNNYFNDPEKDLRFKELLQQLLRILDQSAEAENVLDIEKIFSLFSLDVICWIAFSYQLNATSGSKLGQEVYDSLKIILAGQQQDGLYSFPHMRKVTQKAIDDANGTWKCFLQDIKTKIITSTENQLAEGHKLQPDVYLSHALFFSYKTNEVPSDNNNKIFLRDEEVLSEIHQIIHHGYECFAGSLMWATYALYRHRKVRKSLETSLLENKTEYLECFIKELLRRYPVAGNSPIRSSLQQGQDIAGFDIPVGMPIHVHMFSLHNSLHIWGKKVKDFFPERWFCESTNTSNNTDVNRNNQNTTETRPTCSFLPSSSNLSLNNPTNYSDYHGTGFESDSIAFFPFSVGARSCPSSIFAVQFLRRSLTAIFTKYRLNVSDERVLMEEDVGGSWTSTITPWSHSSMLVIATRIDTEINSENNTSTMNSKEEKSEVRNRLKKDRVSIDNGDGDEEWAKDE